MVQKRAVTRKQSASRPAEKATMPTVQLAATATVAVARNDLLVQPDGEYTAAYKNPSNGEIGVASVQPDGSLQWRAPGTVGPWEKGPVVGNLWLHYDSAYPLGAYAILVVG